MEKRTLLNSGIAIPPTYWNLKRLLVNSNLPEQYGDAATLNEQLQKSIRLTEDILTHAIKNKIENPMDFLKKTFNPNLDVTTLNMTSLTDEPLTNTDVFYQLDEYIKFKTRNLPVKRAYVHNNFKLYLKLFEEFRGKKITFDSFDFNFYEEFVSYLKFDHVHRRRKIIIKGLKQGVIGRVIKHLRIFLRNRMRRKLIPFINLEDFKSIDEESDAIYLTWDEIIRMYETNLSDLPKLERARDLFVFGCMTGLRFSDYSTIEPNDVRNKMLYKKQNKSEHWVVIPLKEEAFTIFSRQFKKEHPNIDNGSFNKEIKEVAKMAGIIQPVKFSYKRCNQDVIETKPKYAWVTSHTCRRSFCTNEFLTGTPVELIMKISGHKSIRDFYRYIKVTPEEAGNKIKEIWQNRGDMKMIKKGPKTFSQLKVV